MKSYLLVLFVCLGLVACAEAPSWDVEATGQPVVYGDDNRVDVYEHPDPIWAQAALNQTVAIMDEWVLILDDPDNIEVWAAFLQQAADLCLDQIWLDQLSAADCSGTLIDTDLVLTAGHCVSGSTVFTTMRFVFNYAMADADALNTITSDDVYSCVEVLVLEETEELDYAIVRLDRPVVGRSPAVLETSSMPLAEGTELVVMGCPTGLPIKIADEGFVRDGRPGSMDYFVSNLDTFSGNSGSGVYRADTRTLVGILVRGDVDYIYDGVDMCSRVHECPMDGCRGEEATYAFVAVEDFCDTVGNSVICACGDGTCDGGAGESTVTCPADCGTDCGDGACNGDESPLNCSDDCGGPCPEGDADGDGVCDDADGCPNDPAKAEPGTCGCGVLETDSDADGTADCIDACPNDPNKIAVGDCGCGVVDTDTDDDGTADCVDACPNDANKIAAGDCGCGVVDTDTDDDGTADCVDACPNDANKIAAGDCGCGVADTDSDADGTADCIDACPNDAGKIAAGDCGCGVLDTDSDADETADCIDGCPEDGDKTEVGICGCGVADTDRDGDGVADCEDACPDDPSASLVEQCEGGDDDSGCGCATGAGQPMEVMIVLLMLAGLVWRRRRD
ncbi:MAG: trypsin-like peptidase domain-containing protein [Deltaproteobacteria bacterium]|nr:trypsin-like peptidase domain-containing protein [Deltaproteobacteria bacterium]